MSTSAKQFLQMVNSLEPLLKKSAFIPGSQVGGVQGSPMMEGEMPMDPAMAGGMQPMPPEGEMPMDPGMMPPEGAMPPPGAEAPPPGAEGGEMPMDPMEMLAGSLEEIVGIIEELQSENQALSARIDEVEQERAKDSGKMDMLMQILNQPPV